MEGAPCCSSVPPSHTAPLPATPHELRSVVRAKRTRCSFVERRTKHYDGYLSTLPILLLSLLVLVPFVTCDSTPSGSFACSQVHYIYNALSKTKGFPHDSKAPKQAVNGDHLKVCSQDLTCCTADMESNLSDQSRTDFERNVQDKIVALRHTFESRTSKFDRFFRELLLKSRHELHSMFQQTYGAFYMGHQQLFSRLFDNLTDYYSTGQTDIEAALDRFYSELYQRMFTIMNPQYNLEDEYWDCMERNMEALKPFGDVPRKMQQQVQRSFVASRVFVQALAVGRDVLHSVMEMPPSEACVSALMRLTYCGHCRGLPSVKPCNNFCLNVVKGCMAQQAELDPDWNAFIDALLELLERLRGPFNIESVIDPINVQISEAIMIFQEKGQDISQQVISGCGQPTTYDRKRRSALNPNRLSLKDLKFGASRKGSSAAGTKLDKLALDIKETIGTSKGFWRSLPHNLCNDRNFAASANEESDCWNGLTRDRYEPALVGDGVSNQLSNPEIQLSSLEQQNSVITDQILRLRITTRRLRDAYNGRDVAAQPPASSTDDLEEMSGSGDDSDDLPSTTRPRDRYRPKETDDEDLWEGSADGVEGSGNLPSPVQIDPRGSHRENDLRPKPPSIWQPNDRFPAQEPPIYEETPEPRHPEFEIHTETSPPIRIEPERPAKGAGWTRICWVTVVLGALFLVV